VLVDVAGLLASGARTGELVARIGGEEFAWVLPETDLEGAVAAAERARTLLASSVVGGDVRVTISAGVALDAGGGADDLLARADGALYRAKDAGRNAVAAHDPATSAAPPETRRRRFQTLSSVRALARAIDARDASTREHSDRVALLAERLALELGWPVARARALYDAGLLHDIGKIAISDHILLKPGRLTPEEFEVIKQHPVIGEQIAAEVLSAEQASWIRAHHERHDGTGYPDRVGGDAIPPGGRLLALADAFDAMTTSRTYKAPLSIEAALVECRSVRGTQFAPDAVDALEALAGVGAIGDPSV
jgi:putative nucleotidyltransferase with HDIG domain